MSLPNSARRPGESLMQARFDALAEAEARGDPPPPPHPDPVFFYGTLALPHVLQKVLKLDEPPTYVDGRLYGFTVKMWGPYPALVPTAPDDFDSFTTGKIWMMPGGEEGERILRRLEQYETENYRRISCMVYFNDGSGRDPQFGYTFKWNSYPEELTEGAFDPSQFPVPTQRHADFCPLNGISTTDYACMISSSTFNSGSDFPE